MNPLRAIWLAVLRFFCFWFLRLHLFRFKSWAYQLFEPGGLREQVIRPMATLAEVMTFQRHGEMWRADGPRALWDAAHSPEFVFAVFAGQLPAPDSDLDCDEHSIGACAIIEASITAGTWKENSTDPHMLSVMWLEGFKPGGHNVTACRFGLGWRWADYRDDWSPVFPSLSELAADVRSRYAGGSSAIGHCLQKHLVPVETHWGE
jgi:hypothetical protein